MKKLITLILFACIGVCLAAPTNSVTKQQMPKQFFTFDFDRPGWKVAHTDRSSSGDHIIIEWTNNEPVTNWSELVTGSILFIDTTKVDAQRFANFYVEGIMPNSIDFKVNCLVDTKDDVVIEWSHKGSGKWPAQREINHISRGKDAIYRLAYTVKEASFDKEKYDFWLKSIKAAKLVDE